VNNELKEEHTPIARRVTVNAKDAAAYLGFSYWLTLELFKKGVLPGIRAGRRVLFRLSALDEWMSKQENKVLQKSEEAASYGKIRRVF
jgi:excisionase family DNA binding protein